MDKEINRYKSFISSSWELQSLVKPLVVSGFFYTGKEDITKCAFCGIEIKNWTIDLDPEYLHKKLSKFCDRYLLTNFSNYNERLKTFKNWTNVICKEKLSDSGFVYLGIKDIVQCFSCKLKLESWDEKDEPDLIHKELSGNCDFLKNRKSTVLNEKFICSICLDNEKNTCFLPCAHVVCCLDCCVNISNKCPVCNIEISQKIRIFI